jgi:hypothetical protein
MYYQVYIFKRSFAGGGYDDRHGGGGRYDAPYGGGYDPPQHAYQPAPAQQPVAVNPSTGQPVSFVSYPVLLIGMLIPDPNFSIPDLKIHIKEFKHFNPKNGFQALGNMIWVVHPGSGSRLFTHPGSRMGKKKSKRHRIPDPQHSPHPSPSPCLFPWGGGGGGADRFRQ